MKTKIDKFDKVFSLLVRERADWRCEAMLPNRCKGYFPEGPGRRMLHASHFHSRRKQSSRFSPINCAAHCFSCHQYLGENPLEFREWIAAHLGEKKLRELNLLAGQIVRRSKRDKEDLYSEMKAWLRFMEAERAKGVTGRIEFEL